MLSCKQFTSYIPLSFVLGFYVSMIVSRWWKQFQNFPWPDRYICNNKIHRLVIMYIFVIKKKRHRLVIMKINRFVIMKIHGFVIMTKNRFDKHFYNT